MKITITDYEGTVFVQYTYNRTTARALLSLVEGLPFDGDDPSPEEVNAMLDAESFIEDLCTALRRRSASDGPWLHNPDDVY